MVGVVGKPNVGKSTFFSAATLATVSIANYPFTTIQPNRGIAYVRKKCVCREFGVTDTPGNSTCVEGTRLIPVELIDCAGLVPGAWQGRGLGNQFLDEIRRADALVHVVDAAGATDEEGKACPPGSHDPGRDVSFLEEELQMWILQIIRKDWLQTLRMVTAGGDLLEILEERLSGLGISRSQIVAAKNIAHIDFDKPALWSDSELRRFVGDLRQRSKPMLIAANKVDIPAAEANIEALKQSNQIIVPCCAEAELALRRSTAAGLVDYVPGNSDFELRRPEALRPEQLQALVRVKDRVLAKWGTTGVQAAIDAAFFNLLSMVVVYPVEDPEHLTDHKGRILPDAYLIPSGTTAKEFASLIHTELGEGFLYAIEARSKMRLGEKYALKDGDVISIVSTKKRT